MTSTVRTMMTARAVPILMPMIVSSRVEILRHPVVSNARSPSMIERDDDAPDHTEPLGEGAHRTSA
jgi:hypothetical protein